jgi:hypothetical protein
MEHAPNCSGLDCPLCAVRCPHCHGRLMRTSLGILTCTAGCAIRVWDLWPGDLERIRTMFAARRRENLARTKRRKAWVSDREIVDVWNADRYVPMTYETVDGG